MKITDEKHWKELLEKDPELKKLAIKAGVENNWEKVEEIREKYDVRIFDFSESLEKNPKLKAERELAWYLYWAIDEEDAKKAFEQTHSQRCAAAHRAGISINDL